MYKARIAKHRVVVCGIQKGDSGSYHILLQLLCCAKTTRRTRQAWNEGVIHELARVKRSMLGRNTRLRNAQAAARASAADNDGGSLASSAESSLRGRVYSDIGVGAADSGIGGAKNTSGGRGGQGRGRGGSKGAPFLADSRFSRFALSLTIPRPKQHNGLTSADVVTDSSGGGGAGGDKNNENSRSSTSSSGSTNRSSNNTRKSSTAKMAQNSSSGTAAVAAGAPVTWGSKLRLDIVRSDIDRNTGLSPRSPRPGGEGGGGGPAGTAATPARFDSAARELLQGYEDEQVHRYRTRFGKSGQKSLNSGIDEERAGDK